MEVAAAFAETLIGRYRESRSAEEGEARSVDAGRNLAISADVAAKYVRRGFAIPRRPGLAAAHRRYRRMARQPCRWWRASAEAAAC